MAAWSELLELPNSNTLLTILLANYLTLDVISDLTYGQPFNLITDPDLRWLVNAIMQGNRRIYMRFAFPALFNVKPSAWYNPDKWFFPDMADERQRFLEVSTKFSEARMASEEKMKGRNDIMSALLAAKDPKTGTKLSEAEVWGEAHLMIAAGKTFLRRAHQIVVLTSRPPKLIRENHLGGDTTSTALAAVLFYLSRNDEAHELLNNEIRSTFPAISEIRQGARLSSCYYLRACLEEAMRLAPPAPGALWREVCMGGAIVDGEQIPAGLDVGVCQYAICRNSSLFPEPYVFKPERHLRGGDSPPRTQSASSDYFGFQPRSMTSSGASPRLSSSQLSASQFSPSYLSPPILAYEGPTPGASTPLPRTPGGNEKPPTFAPFLIGPRSCVAKPFAYLEMSLAIATLVWSLDFIAADSTGEGKPGCGIVGRERKEEFQIMDMFSSSKEGPVLKFKLREETRSHD